MKNTDIWIGRLDVRPRPGNDSLGSAKGAIVNVVALASDEHMFIEAAYAAMDEYGFDVLRCEDVTRMHDWRNENTFHSDLEDLADRLSPESPVHFDEFQSYLYDDA